MIIDESPASIGDHYGELLLPSAAAV